MINQNDIHLGTKLFSDPLWRINHLYAIVDKEGVKRQFTLNWAQEELFKNMWYCNIILKARQLGMSTFILLLFLDRCLFNSYVSAGIIAHTREDAEKMFRRVKFAYDNLPVEVKKLIPCNNDTAKELHFSNGSSLRVGTSLRSSTFQYLHISEFGKICAVYPEKAREIVTGALNTLAPGQYCFIESTAEGRDGYFYEMCNLAMALKEEKKRLTQLDFRFHFFPWYRHPDYRINSENVVIDQELSKYFDSLEKDYSIQLSPDQKSWYAKKAASQKEDMMREFPSTPQESFFSSNEGMYYGRQMARARTQNRISRVYHDPNLPTYIAMDLGLDDATAIWFFQIYRQEIRLIQYYENSGESLIHYLKYIKDTDYVIKEYFVPHDADTREYSTNLSRVQVAANHGVRFTVLPRLEIQDGINAVRNILDKCYFDEEKCSRGIKCLENYSKSWNEKYGCWSEKPLHNQFSHGADAFRYLAMSLDTLNSTVTNIEEYRKLNMYYGYTGYHQSNSILGN